MDDSKLIAQLGDASQLPFYGEDLVQLGIAPDGDSLAIVPDGSGVIPFLASWRIPIANVPVAADGQFQWLRNANVIMPAAVRRMAVYNGDQSETSFLFTSFALEMLQSTTIANRYPDGAADLLLHSYQVGFGSGNNQRFYGALECGSVGSSNKSAAAATTVAATTLDSGTAFGKFSDGGLLAIEGTGMFVRVKNDSASCLIECTRTHGITINGDFFVTARGVAWNGGPINVKNQTGSPNPCAPGASTGMVQKLMSNLRSAAAVKLFRTTGLRG